MKPTKMLCPKSDSFFLVLLVGSVIGMVRAKPVVRNAVGLQTETRVVNKGLVEDRPGQQATDLTADAYYYHHSSSQDHEDYSAGELMAVAEQVANSVSGQPDQLIRRADDHGPPSSGESRVQPTPDVVTIIRDDLASPSASLVLADGTVASPKPAQQDDLPPETFSPLRRQDSSSEMRGRMISDVFLDDERTETEIVTLGAHPTKNLKYLLGDVVGGGGGGLDKQQGAGTFGSAAGVDAKNADTKMRNVFLSADNAVWAGCALVVICSIIIAALLYSRICRTGPYQE